VADADHTLTACGGNTRRLASIYSGNKLRTLGRGSGTRAIRGTPDLGDRRVRIEPRDRVTVLHAPIAELEAGSS
jgi:hypothetical protein